MIPEILNNGKTINHIGYCAGNSKNVCFQENTAFNWLWYGLSPLNGSDIILYPVEATTAFWNECVVFFDNRQCVCSALCSPSRYCLRIVLFSWMRTSVFAINVFVFTSLMLFNQSCSAFYSVLFGSYICLLPKLLDWNNECRLIIGKQYVRFSRWAYLMHAQPKIAIDNFTFIVDKVSRFEQ